MRLRSRIVNGKLEFHGSTSWVKMQISSLPDGEYDVEIKKHFKKRSLSQNAYYWTVVVSMVYDGLRDAGYSEILDAADAHEVLKAMFFKKTIFSEKHDNLEVLKSTTKFSTIEFEERLEEIRKWAFTFLNIIIPLPNTQAAIDFQDGHIK